MIEVHHLNASRSQRILWLLEELELDYDIVMHYRDEITRLAPPSLKQVHPLGRAPIIRDGDLVLPESGAIIEYLVETYGAGTLKPAHGSDDYWRYVFFMHAAEGSTMPWLVMKLVTGLLGEAAAPVRPILDMQIDNQLGYFESELQTRSYFAGDSFTACDIQMSYPLEAAAARAGLDAESYPALWAFVERMQARPAYKRAKERGGHFDLL